MRVIVESAILNLATEPETEERGEERVDLSGPGIRCPNCGIRCPQCCWSPQAHDLWSCSCGHIWNTFDTGGVCPACLRQWTETQCPQCRRWSPHSDWCQRGH